MTTENGRPLKRPQIVNLELEDLPETHTRTAEYIARLEYANARYIETREERKRELFETKQEARRLMRELMNVRAALRLAEDELWKAPELNLCNYTHEEVRDLNNAMIEIHQVLSGVLPNAPGIIKHEWK